MVLDNLIVNDTNGFLIEKHSTKAISELFERLCANKIVLQSIGIERRKLASEYTWESYRNNFTKFMLEVVNTNL